MDRLAASLALLATLLLAGCSSPSEDDQDSVPEADGGEVAGDAAAASAEAGAEPVLVAQDDPVHLEGTTSTGGCVYAMGAGSCEWVNGAGNFQPLDGGSPLRLAGTLTWSAVTPDELSVYVLHERDGSYWFDEGSPVLWGPSPLAFDFDLSKYAETPVAIGVSSNSGVGVPMGYASYGTSQDFVLDAVHTSLVPPA